MAGSEAEHGPLPSGSSRGGSGEGNEGAERPASGGPGPLSDTFRDLLDSLQSGFAEAHDAGVPGTVGSYRIGRRLGAGAMGGVYEGIHLRHPEIVVAIKFPRPLLGLPDPLAEARLLARLEHPNLVGIRDYGREAGRPWIAMERVAGQTLRDVIRGDPRSSSFFEEVGGEALLVSSPERTRIEPVTAIAWMRDLARGLAEMHRHDVVHRDIKPANIVIDRHGRPVLVDFGLALREGADPFAGALAGTLPYMSPEQCLHGLAPPGPASDLYALAVTFFEALTGRRACRGESETQMLEDIAFGAAPRLSEHGVAVDADLEEIFARLLEKRPDRRLGDAAELARRLDSWLVRRRGSNRLQRTLHRMTSRLRARPRVAGASALVAVLLLGAAVAPRVRDRWNRGRARDAVAEMVDGGRYEAALLATEEALDRWPDDAELGLRFREVVARVAPRLTDRMLLASTFSIRGRRDAPELVETTRRARRRLARVADPDLLLQAAFGLALEGDFEGVNALLADERHAALVAADRRLLELSARALMEVGSVAPCREVLGRISRRGPPRTAAAICLQGQRRLRQHALAEEGRVELAIDPWAEEDLAQELEGLLHRDPRNLLARSLLALLQFQRRDFAAARRDMVAVHHAVTRADRDAILLWIAATSVLEAASLPPDAPRAEELVRDAVRDARLGARDDPHLIAWLCDRVSYHAPTAAAPLRWWASWLAPDHSGRADLPPEYWSFVQDLLTLADQEDHDFAGILAFARTARGFVPEGEDSLACWRRIQARALDARCELIDRGAAAGHDVATLVAEARSQLNHLDALAGAAWPPASYDEAWSRARLLHCLWSHGSEGEQRDRDEEAARGALTTVSRSELVDDALAAADDDAVKQGIRSLAARAERMLRSMPRH